jgi:thioredoxin 1
MQSTKNTKSSDKIEIKSNDDFSTYVLKSITPVIVNFHTAGYFPCKKLDRMLEEAFKKEGTFKLVKINKDNHKDLASEYKVKSTPHTFLFNEGMPVSEFNGVDEVSLKYMLITIKTLINLPVEPTEGYNIILRYGDDSFIRKFDGENTIQDIINYAKEQIGTSNDINLSQECPKRVYIDKTQLIKESELSKNQILRVSRILY